MRKLNLTFLNVMSFVAIILTISSCEEWLDFGDDDEGGGILTPVTFAKDLDTPWEMEFAPDGRLFLTQRPGIVSIIDQGNTIDWLKLDSVVAEIQESGLTGLALHPDFSSNHYVYINFTYAISKSPLVLVNKIVRYREDPTSHKPVWDKVILDGVKGNYLHNIGALQFGPDGMLYATSGDIFKPELAQNPAELSGKVLRIGPDGEVPNDNPTNGSYVYSYGHRNPQGIAFQPGTNSLWSTEHGPSVEQGCCMDEVNLIKPGANYGWPNIRGSQKQVGLESPKYYSGDTTTWAPTGGYFAKHGEWKGSFLFTGLKGQALYRAVFDASDAGKIVKIERYLHNQFGRLRYVVEDDKGNIYLAVSNQDGRGLPGFDEDRIVKMSVSQIKLLGMDETGVPVQ